MCATERATVKSWLQGVNLDFTVAMGAANVNSIQFSGSGTNYAFGQAYTPGGPWPRFEVKTYTAAIDYQTR